MKLHSIKDVADMLNVSTKTVYRLISRGKMRIIKIGRSSRIAENEIVTYLRSLGYQGA